MKELFYQPEDQRFAVQRQDGRYLKKEEKISDALINEHLNGNVTLGAYTTFQNSCIFGVWDIDLNKEIYSVYASPDEAFQHFKNDIIEINQQFDCHIDYPHYFEFSGRKGCHVWFFLEEHTDSRMVYEYLHHIRKQVNYEKDTFTIELFPKQPSTTGDGNLIKLPLAIHRATGQRSFWCDAEFNRIELNWDDIQKCRLEYYKFSGNQVPQFSQPAVTANPVFSTPTVSGISGEVDFINYTPEGLQNLEDNCNALKKDVSRGTAASNDRNVFIGAVFLRLNRPDKVHEYLKRDYSGYDPANCDYHIQKMQENMVNYQPITCAFAQEKGLCDHTCNTRTPFDHLQNIPIRLDDIRTVSSGIESWFTTATNPPLFTLNEALVKLDLAIEKTVDQYSAPMAKQAVRIFEKTFTMNDQRLNEKPIVINTIPGGYKTTAMIEFVVNALKVDDNFGAVVVVERNLDVKRVTDEINKWAVKFRNVLCASPAYAFYGYDPEKPEECRMGHKQYFAGMCNKKNCPVEVKECRVKKNHILQQEFPVVVMSHARLKLYSARNDEMGRFQFWKFGRMIKHRRTHLLIDEQPNLLENLKLTEGNLTEFLTTVSGMENGAEYYTRLEAPVNAVINLLYSGEEPRIKIQPKTVPKFLFDSFFNSQWLDHTIGRTEVTDIPTALECLSEYGGIFVKQNLNNEPEISTGYYSSTNWRYFDRIIILDGTSDVSQLYPPKVFQKVYIPQFHTYEHLTVNACNVFNLSRTTYQNSDNLIFNLSQDIKALTDKHEKIYVVVYKENKEQYESELSDEINLDKVIIRTLGSTRGDNAMRECDAIIFTGLIHKGEMNYLTESLILNGNTNMKLSAQKAGKARKFEDRETEKIKLASMLEDFVQEVYRTRLRKHDLSQGVHVYMLMSDNDFLSLVRDYFEGCVVENWYPVHALKERLKGVALKIVEKVMERIENGEKVILKRDLGVNVHTLPSTLRRHPEIKLYLESQGITITNREFKILKK
ncbi:MAG: hypothetical protein JXL67_13375 [Calditrichaeota bacterium]|nr:hypothetical protein [Calditrichota bacterium]